MTMSTIPTSNTESSEQSSSPEVSDELIMALTTGQCWAIMEVSSPIWGTSPRWSGGEQWWRQEKLAIPHIPGLCGWIWEDDALRLSRCNMEEAWHSRGRRRHMVHLCLPIPRRRTIFHPWSSTIHLRRLSPPPQMLFWRLWRSRGSGGNISYGPIMMDKLSVCLSVRPSV